ncbi:MAG TPA: divalent-cation tolerance protein CutA [Candidatus Obscuribacterales bacterium]
MSGEIVVLVTCPAEHSEKLASTLVEEHLAACVNIVQSVKSIYFWDGKVCNDSEDLLVVKSRRSAWDQLRERVKQLHSYEVPEIVCFPLEDGYQPYMEWLNKAVTR